MVSIGVVAVNRSLLLNKLVDAFSWLFLVGEIGSAYDLTASVAAGHESFALNESVVRSARFGATQLTIFLDSYSGQLLLRCLLKGPPSLKAKLPLTARSNLKLCLAMKSFVNYHYHLLRSYHTNTYSMRDKV